MGFMSILDNAFIIACLVGFSGCGQPSSNSSTGVPTSSTPSASSSSSGSSSSSDSSSSSSNVSVTFYTQTRTTKSNGVTTTFTAYCTTYSGTTYCWDDGVYALHVPFGVAGISATYWNIGSTNVSGGCFYGGSDLTESGQTVTDCVLSPTIVSPAFGMVAIAVNNVLAGTAATVSCTLDGNENVVCPSFTINVNQEAL